IDTGDHSFLLESVEKGGRLSRYSFLGANPSKIFRMREGHVTIWDSGQTQSYDSKLDPLAELQGLMSHYRPVGYDSLPLFHGGAVGYLAHEAVTYFEKSVQRAQEDDLQIPDAYFVISDTLLIFDHHEAKIKIVANAVVNGDPIKAYEEAV